MPLYVLVLLFIPIIDAEAQLPIHQSNWAPNNYVVVCKQDEPCPLNSEQAKRVGKMMLEASAGMKSLPFDPPRDWGQRQEQGTGNEHIRLYQMGDGIAQAQPNCGSEDTNYSYMEVGPKAFDSYFDGRDYILYYLMSHEIFHLIQYGYTLWNSVPCGKLPGWIREGTATAVGIEAMRKRYPSAYPSIRDEREARNFAGLRRYDEPMPRHKKDYRGNQMFSGDKPTYWTSSFWQHLAYAYHGGNYSYLHRYMQRSGDANNWIPWLRSNLRVDLDRDLATVFSGFLADYAGWGDPGYPGTYFGRRNWLKGAFGGCETVYLDKKNKHDWVELEILPLSGKCIEVRVLVIGENGLQEDESASIQVAAEIAGGKSEFLSGLHVSLATSNDSTGFHCAKVAKVGQKQGIDQCIMNPYKGKLNLPDVKLDAKVWNIKPHDSSQKPVITENSGNMALRLQKQGSGKGELINIYTVSNTPPGVSSADTNFGGRNPVKAKIHFVFDVVKEHASMDFGNESGSKLDFPDIAATLPIELDLFDWAYVNRSQYHKVGDNYVGRGVAEGIIEPCYLSFHLLNSETQDTISFNMFHPGAITPGEYEFANRLDIASDTEYIPARKVPGMLVGGFAMGPKNPEGNGLYKEYTITAGTLSIDSISGSLVQGHLTAYGSHREWSEETRRKEVTEQRSVALRFSIDTKESAAKKYSPAPYSCLLAEPAEKSSHSQKSSSNSKPTTSETLSDTTGQKPDKDTEKNSKKETKEEGRGVPSEQPINESTASFEKNPTEDKRKDPTTNDPQNRPRYTEPFQNRFYLKATGDVDYEQTLIDKDFSIFAGCTGTDPLTTGFASNLKTGFADRDWFQVGTKEVVRPGDTGLYKTRFMMWLNGVEQPPGMPSDSQIKVSRKFEGSGTINLTHHVATGSKRRMQGTVNGEVKQKYGELKVQIYAEFDLAQSCGTKDVMQR